MNLNSNKLKKDTSQTSTGSTKYYTNIDNNRISCICK